jgi:hypothetical protein
MKLRISPRATQVAASALVFGIAATASAQQQLDLTGVWDVEQQCAGIANAMPVSVNRSLTAQIIHDPMTDEFDMFIANGQNTLRPGQQQLKYRGEVQVSNVVRDFLDNDPLDDFTRAQGFAIACDGTFVDDEEGATSLAYGEAILIDARIDGNNFAGYSTYGTSHRPTLVQQSPVEFGTCTYRFTPVTSEVEPTFTPCPTW